MQDIDLNLCNTTELLQLVFHDTGVRFCRSMPREWLVAIIEQGRGLPGEPQEFPKTREGRAELEKWISRTPQVHSQLPCKGVDSGRCTRYGCTEIRHLDCYLAGKPYLL